MQRGFQELGWTVNSYIAGDRHKRASATEELSLRGSAVKRIAQDAIRVAANGVAYADLRKIVHADLIYERFATLQALGAVQRRRLNAPWVIESNGLFFREAAESRQALALTTLARAVESGAYKSADLVVCVSDVLRQEITEVVPDIDQSRLVVVPNGVDASRLPVSAGGSCDELRVLFVGTLIEWQGVEVLLHAVSLLPAETKSRVKVRIIGEGPARGALQRQVIKLGIKSQVDFFGRLPSDMVAQHLAWGYVGYAGHVSSGQKTYHSPLKLLEYAASGLAIICTPSADAEILRGMGYPVRIVEPADPHCLAAALRGLDVQRLSPHPDVVARVRAEASWRGRVQQVLDALARRGINL